MSTYFDRHDAGLLLGKNIRTKVEFADVPPGSTGRCVSYYPAGGRNIKLGYGIEITWDRNRITDGFSKDEFEEFIEVI